MDVVSSEDMAHARVPVYMRIAMEIEELIRVGTYRPGDYLPSYAQLGHQYEVAPGTLRQALRVVADRGLLRFEHGRGNVVLEPVFKMTLNTRTPDKWLAVDLQTHDVWAGTRQRGTGPGWTWKRASSTKLAQLRAILDEEGVPGE